MVVWNSMLLKIIIILSGVVRQHVRFIKFLFLMVGYIAIFVTLVQLGSYFYSAVNLCLSDEFT